MRTSKISQDTTRIFNALSPNSRTRSSTRKSKRIATFALGYDGNLEVNEEENESHTTSPGSESLRSIDIEDAVSPIVRSPRKRKLGAAIPFTSKSTRIKQESIQQTIKAEEEEVSVADISPRAKAKPKVPAKRSTSPGGTVRIHPPANWSELYSIVKAQRQRNPNAPVDTMGCEDLYWRNSSPRDKRYHTLTALMLSSQTKDTVTAVAMHRLHTELVSERSIGEDGKQQSALTVENILACDAVHLDNLIGKVGFHNNKTKFIKKVAQILKQDYHSDIPNTIEGLVSLPGVGPKMAYLCMSAAWGIDEGIGVDVHVHRITNLWGWHNTKTPEETRMWLEGWLPKDKWHEINKLLVGLGQTVCLPVGRRCGECDLSGTRLCKAEIRGWKATERKVKRETISIKMEDNSSILKSEHNVLEDIQIKQETVES